MLSISGIHNYLSARPVLRGSLILVLIVTCSFYFEACRGNYKSTFTQEDLKESKPSEGEYILDLRMLDGKKLTFVPATAYYNDWTRSIVGQLDSFKTRLRIPIDSVSSMRVMRNSGTLAFFKTLGVILIVPIFLALAIVASSCPFIYTHNGEEFVLDAEPLGGSIAEGLERTDLSPLNNIKPVHGKYLVMSRNESDETQHIDEMKLLYVDHAPDQQVVADALGQLHLVNIPQAPIKATDARGESILDLVSMKDKKLWRSEPSTDDSAPFRDELTFTFKRPANVSEGRLVVKMGTALWGGSLIRSMLELRGDSVDAWYRSVNSYGAEFKKLAMFNMREELFLLKVFVKEGDAWVQREMISGSGPFVTEERTLPIDLSKVKGDEVEIRIAPPEGFWQIDQFAMSFGASTEVEGKELTMTKFTTSDKTQSAELLASVDKKRYDMPTVGDEFTMEFDAPEMAANVQRAVFLRTHGYYDLHLPKGNPENTQLLRELVSKPGAIMKYSRARLRDWIANPEKYEKLPTRVSR